MLKHMISTTIQISDSLTTFHQSKTGLVQYSDDLCNLLHLNLNIWSPGKWYLFQLTILSLCYNFSLIIILIQFPLYIGFEYKGNLKSGHVQISNGQSLLGFRMVRIWNGSFALTIF